MGPGYEYEYHVMPLHKMNPPKGTLVVHIDDMKPLEEEEVDQFNKFINSVENA